MSAANADADIAYSISLGDELVPTFERTTGSSTCC